MTMTDQEAARNALDDALDQAANLLDAPPVRSSGVGIIDTRFKTRRVVTRSKNAWVLEAEHVVTNRGLALKVAFPHEQSRSRIRAAAVALGALAHVDGVVDVLDARVDGETATYVALEWIAGRSLEGLLAARGTLPPAAIPALGSVIADTLAEVHAAGWVHGDLAAKHVFLTRGRNGRETVKLIDFGAAVPIEERTDGKLSPANDVYALGAMLARALVGSAQPSRDDLPDGALGALLLRTLDPTPTARPTAADLVRELLRVREEGERTSVVVSEPQPVTPPPVVAAPPPVVAAPPPVVAAPPPAATPKPPPVPVRAAAPAPPPLRKKPPPPARSIELDLPTSGPDMRKKPRASYVTPVLVTRQSGTLEGRTEDLSESGVLLVLRDPCVAGERVDLRFALPIDGLVATCTARVAWSRSHAGAPGTHAVGVELLEPPRAITDAIAKYVKILGVT